MYANPDEYNIFILETETISRFEIGTSDSKWHDVNSTILYGEYKRRVSRTFGDGRIGNLYADTIQNAKTIEAAPQIITRWDGGVFYSETLKYLSEDEYYCHAEKTGRFYSERCRYGGVGIEVYVYDEAFNLDLAPVNRREYKKAKLSVNRPETHENAAEYDNCVYLAVVFEELFKSHAKTSIDLNSDKALSLLLYGEMNIPVLVKGKNGLGSVRPKAIRALASIKKETPSSVFKSGVTDKNGRRILSADEINRAEYPAAVFLYKYRYYAERARLLSRE